jgi:RNA polymerase sigma-70 factor, ECF subfamily
MQITNPLTMGEYEFAAFVEKSAPRTRAVIARLMRNEADTDDVLQETYMAAWASRDSFDGRSTMNTWLHKIAVNRALNHLRHLKSLRRWLDTDTASSAGCATAIDSLADKNADGRMLAATHAIRELIWTAVDDLPDDARLVLVLRDVEGFSSDEVAEKIGITSASVRQRLHRARRTVAERLQPELRDAGHLTCGGQLDLLLDYIDDELSPQWVKPVTEHLQTCKTCAKYAKMYARIKQLPRETADSISVPAVRADLISTIVAVCR